MSNKNIRIYTSGKRKFVGTWTIEVSKALEVGYEIRETYEVWHFEHSTELLRGYISDFLKIKLETSPRPPICARFKNNWTLIWT